MKHKLLKNKILKLENEIFTCSKCDELTRLRKEKICNCPVLGFDFQHYLNATIVSIGEAPGIYKPQKGEVYIEKLEDFHKIYDDRIQNVALIGKRMMSIYDKAGVAWDNIQHFNVVCCSPPDYRKPTIDEVSNCLDYLKYRIELMQNKKLIVCFGNVAKTAIKQLKFNLPVVNAYHPTYIYKYMSSSSKEEYILEIANKIKEALQK